MRVGGLELRFLIRVGAPLILTAGIIQGVKAHLLWRKTKGKVGLSGLRAELSAGGGDSALRPRSSPTETFNLDFSVLASGPGGEPTQRGVLSVTIPRPPPPLTQMSTAARGPYTRATRPRPVRLGLRAQLTPSPCALGVCWPGPAGTRVPRPLLIAGGSCGVQRNNGDPVLAGTSLATLSPSPGHPAGRWGHPGALEAQANGARGQQYGACWASPWGQSTQ